MPLTETKNWWPLKLTFPIMISFDYYEEIEEMRHTLSTLLNTKLECFEIGDGAVMEEEEMGVKLVKHTGDFYVGLFQPVNPPEMYRFPTRDEVWGD